MGFSLKRLMDIGMLETIWVCPISKLMYIIGESLIDTSNFLVQTLTGTQNPPQVFPRCFLAISLAIPITYFIDIIRVHTLTINPLVPYAIEISILILASILFPVLGIWFFKYVDRKCRLNGSLHVH